MLLPFVPARSCLCFVADGIAAFNLALFHRSPVRRAPTFFLDKKSRQKSQDAPNSLTAQTVCCQRCTWLKLQLRSCRCKLALLYLPVVCDRNLNAYTLMAVATEAPYPVLGVGALFKRGGMGWGITSSQVPLLGLLRTGVRR